MRNKPVDWSVFRAFRSRNPSQTDKEGLLRLIPQLIEGAKNGINPLVHIDTLSAMESGSYRAMLLDLKRPHDHLWPHVMPNHRRSDMAVTALRNIQRRLKETL